MDLANARSLSNDFQAVRLCSLSRWSGAAALAPEGTHGPYVILQSGIDPQDPTASVDDFILGAHGRWLPLYLFYLLPQEVRRQQFVFPTAAEAIGVLERLTGKVSVERARADGAPAGEDTDDLNKAVAEVRRDDPGGLPKFG